MAESSVPTGVTRSVLRQVEYYFSDSNFPKDKFLMAEVAKSDEGWVNLTVIAGFNKIKGLVQRKAGGTKTKAAQAAAARGKSKTSR